MAAFPRTYSVVRGGWAETVTVPDLQTLQELRTELELLLHVGAGADDTLLSALDARIGQLRNAKGAGPATKLADVSDWRQLLADALVPVNAMTAACIDADFPDIKGTLNMSAINEQNKQFHDDVAAEVRSSEVADATTLAEAFAHATSEIEQEQETEAELGMSNEAEAVADNDENDAAEPAGSTLIEEALEAASTMLDDTDDLLTQIGDTADAGVDEQATLSEDEDGDEEQAAASDEDFQEIAAGLTQAADDLAQLSSAVEQAGGRSDMEETLGLQVLDAEGADAETVAREASSQCEATHEETPKEAVDSSIEETPEMFAEAASPVEEGTAGPMDVGVADETVADTEASSAFDEAAGDAEADADDRAAFKKLFESASATEQGPGLAADETPSVAAREEDAAADREQTSMSVPTDSSVPDAVDAVTADSSDEAERMAEELGKAVATAALGSDVPAESAGPFSPSPFAAFSACSPTEPNTSINTFRGQLNEIKLNLVAQIDRLGTVLEGAAQAQVRAEQTLRQADALKRAATQIFDAASQFGEAQRQAQAAQAACEKAAERVARARFAWEVAQQQAGEATRGSEHPGQD